MQQPDGLCLRDWDFFLRFLWVADGYPESRNGVTELRHMFLMMLWEEKLLYEEVEGLADVAIANEHKAAMMADREAFRDRLARTDGLLFRFYLEQELGDEQE